MELKLMCKARIRRARGRLVPGEVGEVGKDQTKPGLGGHMEDFRFILKKIKCI